MIRMHTILVVAVALALVAGTGCKKKHIKTPADFAEMEDPGWDFKYRAISPDEVVLGVQKKANEPRGDAEFWMKVWKEKYPPIKDYDYVSDEKISTTAGQNGYLLEYKSEEEDGSYRFMVAIFVKKKDIWILTAGGKDEVITEHRDTIISAFKTFKP
jgi:hypothetical protein